MREADNIIFSPFRLDILNEKLWRENEAVPLRPKTFAILHYLAGHPGRLVSKTELLRAIWGDTQVSEEGLRDYIREIRKALSDNSASPRFVETARGRGYRFIAPLTTVAPPVPSSKFPVPSQQEAVNCQLSAVSNIEGGNGVQKKNEAAPQWSKTSPLLTIRGVYDGKTFRALPTEFVPPISREVSVAILFLEDVQMEPESLANELLLDPLWQPHSARNGTLSFNGSKKEE